MTANNVRCSECDEHIHPKRAALGYRLCLDCGEQASRKIKRCVVPAYNKGAYQLVTDYADLKYINPKRQPD